MSRSTRMVAALMAALMVLAVGAPAVAAHDQVTISVDEGDSTYTVTVEHNNSAVENASVDVQATNDSNATYSASGDTGPNGTVTFDLPENETEVNITATFENHSQTRTVVLSGANETDGANGVFGQLVSTMVRNLVTNTDNNTVLGLTIAEFVTANNPGADHRSDKANPGGNATGPPEHAVNESSDAGNRSGPPEHAVNKSSDAGNNSANGGNATSTSGGSDNGNGNGSDGNKGGNSADKGGNESLARAAEL